ncbi:MAG TPA: hypothetical protein EYP56_21060, partial [Planctomycetaceae bacterium]|nr:hypothetical protein [Planctomycetaceae bacterium]
MWQPVFTPTSRETIFGLCASPSFDTNGTIFCLGNRGSVFFSTDSGSTWGGIYGLSATAIGFLHDEKAIVGTRNGELHLVKNGRTVMIGTLKRVYDITCLASVPEKTGELLFVGTKKSEVITYDQKRTCVISANVLSPGSAITSIAVATDWAGATLVLSSTWHDAIYQSTDFGATWLHQGEG